MMCSRGEERPHDELPDRHALLPVAASPAPRRLMSASSERRAQSGDLAIRWIRFSLGVLTAFLIMGVAVVYTNRQSYADDFAGLSRGVIGDESTARIESWYFALQDRYDRTKYALVGGEENPFSEDPEETRYLVTPVASPAVVAALTPTPESVSNQAPSASPAPTPPPMRLPVTRQVSASLEPGEGIWTNEGLPRTSPDDVLMAKTFVRPDHERPYATVGVLLVDHRRVRLHMTGGTEDPGGDLGVSGPGLIPPEHLPHLLVAWNGGFRGPHGGFGMYADGRQYRPLRDGYASAVVYEDGRVRIGQWGRDLTWSEDIVAVRQNAALLVEECEVSSRTNEGNDTWGYVQVDSSEFITWRSAIGLTRDGDLLVAAGNSLSASSLARGLWAAGACWAMQLDINVPYVLTSLFFHQPDGSIEAERFMRSMADTPARFLGTQTNDFMYLTLDETKTLP